MPLAHGGIWRTLYVRSQRDALFNDPNHPYTWKTALSFAYNLSLAVERVHAAGHVVGDLNPKNSLASPNGITLLDADGFTIKNPATGEMFMTQVGVPEMLAPELQGQNLAAATFTPESDNFSLAIAIFRTLMLDESPHPFVAITPAAATSSTSGTHDERNIREGYCPYIKAIPGTQIPPYAPTLDALPLELGRLFRRAFTYEAATVAFRKDERPTAREWRQALGTILSQVDRLAACPNDKTHYYPASNASCPWCAAKARMSAATAAGARAARVAAAPSAASNAPIAFAASNAYAAPAASARTPRAVWPLDVVFVVFGAISGTLLSTMVRQVVGSVVGYHMSAAFAQIAVMILGALSGWGIAALVRGKYRASARGWPHFLWAFAIPPGAVLASFLVALVIFLVLAILAILAVCLALGGG
jgi:hypothetical protein